MLTVSAPPGRPAPALDRPGVVAKGAAAAAAAARLGGLGGGLLPVWGKGMPCRCCIGASKEAEGVEDGRGGEKGGAMARGEKLSSSSLLVVTGSSKGVFARFVLLVERR